MCHGSSYFKKIVLCSVISMVSNSVNAVVLEEIIISAQKREQRVQDVPISLEVLAGDDLNKTQINSTEDLALSVPSISFVKGFSPSASSFGIRGLSTFNLEGGLQPSVALVIDGVPVTRATEFLTQLGDIQRIEVLRGPQGTLFGRNATAGAISVVRNDPTEEFEGQAEISYTDDNELITRGMVSGALSEKMRGRFVGFYKHLDDYIKNDHPTTSDLGGEESYGVMGKLDLDLSDDASMLLTAEYIEQDVDLSSAVVTVVEGTPGVSSSLPSAAALPSAYYPVTGEGIGQARLAALGNGDINAGRAVINDLNRVNENQEAKADSKNWGITADLTWRLNGDVTLKSITAYRDFWFGSNPDVEASPASPSNPMGLPVVGIPQTDQSTADKGYLTIYDTHYFTQELRLEGSGDRIEWVSGFFYQNFVESADNEAGLLISDTGFEKSLPSSLAFLSDGVVGNNYYFSLPDVSRTAEWDSYAVFADVTFDVSDSVQLFGGLRWSWEDIELNFKRNDRTGPAGDWNGTSFNPSAYFNVISDNWVEIDTGALAGHPIWKNFQKLTEFNRQSRSEDWSGRLGVNWALDADLNLYTSVSRGFVGSGVSAGRRTVAETSILNPSVAKAVEMGLKSSLFDGSMQLNAALFWQETSDLQTSRLIPGGVTTETFNAGVLTAKGLELDVTWAATEQLTLNSSITVLDTQMSELIQPCYPGQTLAQGCAIDNDGNGKNESQDVDGKTGVASPDLAYKLSAKYQIPLAGQGFDIYVMSTYSWRDDTQMKLTYDPMTTIDAYGITDVFVGFVDKEGAYEVQLFGKNVADTQYVTGLDAAEGSIARQYTRVGRYGAYYGIKLTYNFK